MKQLLNQRPTYMLGLLLIATFVAYFLGTRSGPESVPELKSIVWVELIVIAFLKVRWVILDFMELRTAPVSLRLLFEFWAAATAALLIAHNWIVG